MAIEGRAVTEDELLLEALIATYDLVDSNRPGDRTKRDRAFAVFLTDFEKNIAWFRTAIVDGNLLGVDTDG